MEGMLVFSHFNPGCHDCVKQVTAVVLLARLSVKRETNKLEVVDMFYFNGLKVI
jgi:hypothetical protein